MSSHKEKIIQVGIMPLAEFKKRTIDVAKGNYKFKKEGPKIWFPSIKSLAQVLSEENQNLLKLIVETEPKSISELEDVTGRKANNLLRTLRTMEGYGFVKLIQGKSSRGRAPLMPKVIYTAAKIEISFM